MTYPYGPIRQAVDAYAAASRPVGVGATGAGPQPVFAGFEPAVGVYDVALGKLVATYPAVGYARHLEALAVECSDIVPVHLYVGAITPTSRLTSYGDGSLADYSPAIPRYIPAGSALFVVWDVSSSTQTGSANAQLRQAS